MGLFEGVMYSLGMTFVIGGILGYDKKRTMIASTIIHFLVLPVQWAMLFLCIIWFALQTYHFQSRVRAEQDQALMQARWQREEAARLAWEESQGRSRM